MKTTLYYIKKIIKHFFFSENFHGGNISRQIIKKHQYILKKISIQILEKEVMEIQQ